MLPVLIAALVLMVAGGVIAYIGDTWGYKLGKKRLTFLGLRPRVTANLLTVVFGVLIALLTFSVLLGVSANFRVALIQGVGLVHQNNALRRSNQELTSQNSGLSAKNKALQQEEQQVRDQLDPARKRLAVAETQLAIAAQNLRKVNIERQVAQNQVAAAKTEVASLKTQQQRLIQITKALDDQAKVGITHHLIYTTGAEVGRTVIPASQSQAAIRRDIFDFLGGLGDQAKKQGAAKPGVVVASVRLGNTFVDENDSVSALAGQIQAQGKGSVVVIAYSVGNAFASKPVFIRLRPYSNRLVIPAGAILGETIIPAKQRGVSEILAEMEAFLHGPVHEAALRRGVIPVLPQDYIGDASHEIDPAFQQIQQIKGDAVLVALSTKDTYAGDKVSLDFAVHPVAGQAVAAQGSQP